MDDQPRRPRTPAQYSAWASGMMEEERGIAFAAFKERFRRGHAPRGGTDDDRIERLR